MNIINLDAAGDVVDPEDWSPQRTQYIESLAAGKSVTLSWRVNAILDGDYLVYMVLLPEPSGEKATSQPTASSAIHLTVTPFTKLNPGGVLPFAIGGPAVLILGMSLLNRYRRRQIDTGANPSNPHSAGGDPSQLAGFWCLPKKELRKRNFYLTVVLKRCKPVQIQPCCGR